LHNRNLWLDEAALAVAIRDSSYAQLLNPLEFLQIAPIGFIYLTKCLINIFGSNEYIFRLIPLLAGIGSLLIFYRLANLVLSAGSSLIAIFIFSSTPFLIYYSQEFKQYSLDVFFCLLLVFIHHNRDVLSHKYNLIFLLVGTTATYFSHGSIFALAAISLYSALRSLNNKDYLEMFKSIFYGLLFLLMFLINYYLFIKTNASQGEIQSYWTQYFLPYPFSIESLTVWRNLINSFYEFCDLYGPIKPLIFFLFFIGLTGFNNDRTAIYLLSLIIIGLVIIASMLSILPFSSRLILFIIPFFYIMVLYGLDKLLFLSQNLGLVCGAVIFISYTPLIINNFQPFYKEEISSLLEIINSDLLKDDGVYIYYGAIPAARFYLGTISNDPQFIMGVDSRSDRTKYLGDIKKFSAYHRVWILFSHLHSDEREFFLNNFAYSILQQRSAPGASLYLIGNEL
jgi:uncharacterized membrane protein